MTSNQVAFLYKAACSLPNKDNNENLKLLKSYYLMRCQQISNCHGLPEKQFSIKTRCPKCCIEWSKGSTVKLKPIKLSKKQRRRIRELKPSKEREDKMNLLLSNQLEQICLFCKNSTVTNVLKPDSLKITINYSQKITGDFNKNISKPSKGKLNEKTTKPMKDNIQKDKNIKSSNFKQEKAKTSPGVNIYGTAKDVFSLKNMNNTLSTAIKEAPKVIKNNKRKKDKFAGLCQKAVLTSMKMKEEKQKQNKLNLFLKPSG